MAKEKHEHGPGQKGAASPSPKEGAVSAGSKVPVSHSHLTAAAHNGSVEHVIDVSKTWAIIKKNWMVLKGDKVRLLPLFFMPIVMIIIFGYATGNLPKHLPTAVVDYDQSVFSHAVVEQLSGVDFFSIQYQVGTQDEGKKLLDSGKIKVLFILPQGMGEQAASGEPVQINLMVDESDSSVAQAGKSAALSFSQALSASVTQKRLAALSAQAQTASGSLARSRQVMVSIASFDITPQLAAASALAGEASTVYSKSNVRLKASIVGLQNSLGFLIDQNEVLSGYGPGSLDQAALAQLATGDSQASTLQQIALFQAVQGSQARIASDAQRLLASAKNIATQASAQAEGARAAISFQDAAGRQLEVISNGVPLAANGVSIHILQPYGYDRRGIDFLLPAILALIIFQGATMGLGRAIAGERKDGSLTRVFLTPTSNVTIIVGTQVFYLLLETIRSSLIIFVAILLFGVSISGSIPDIVFIIAIFALGATGVGMVLSVMTKTQEQYMALGMLVSMPMMFLSGAFFPIQTMPPVLQSVAQFLPVTYAADAMRGVMVKGFSLGQLLPDIVALAVFGIFTITLSLLLFKRELV